jgi:hypothetical protein
MSSLRKRLEALEHRKSGETVTLTMGDGEVISFSAGRDLAARLMRALLNGAATPEESRMLRQLGEAVTVESSDGAQLYGLIGALVNTPHEPQEVTNERKQ